MANAWIALKCFNPSDILVMFFLFITGLRIWKLSIVLPVGDPSY